MTFGQRNPYFLEILANPRFKFSHPKHLMQPFIDRGEVGVSPLDVGLVGLGPFRLERYDRGSLRPRAAFRSLLGERRGRRLPYLDGIEYVIMTDPLAMDVAFRSGASTAVHAGRATISAWSASLPTREDLGDSVFYARTEGRNLRLAFDMMRPGPWQDVRVRRAISLWIDRGLPAIPLALGGFGWTSPDLGPPDPPSPVTSRAGRSSTCAPSPRSGSRRSR